MGVDLAGPAAGTLRHSGAIDRRYMRSFGWEAQGWTHAPIFAKRDVVVPNTSSPPMLSETEAPAMAAPSRPRRSVELPQKHVPTCRKRLLRSPATAESGWN